MGSQPGPLNYFNYFTEVEDHFRIVRGTGLFLMSPLDWALVETWKDAGVPLEAVLRGIDAAFEKWRTKKHRIQKVNGLAWCTQPVLLEAQAMAGAAQSRPRKQTEAPFSLDELKQHLTLNAADLRKQPGFSEIAETLDRFAAEAESMYEDLEQAEQWLTGLEDKMIAIARTRQTDEELFQSRRDLERELRPYRSKMTAEQLALLEQQYLERRMLDQARLPRLSLFYLR